MYVLIKYLQVSNEANTESMNLTIVLNTKKENVDSLIKTKLKEAKTWQNS